MQEAKLGQFVTGLLCEDLPVRIDAPVNHAHHVLHHGVELLNHQLARARNLGIQVGLCFHLLTQLVHLRLQTHFNQKLVRRDSDESIASPE